MSSRFPPEFLPELSTEHISRSPRDSSRWMCNGIFTVFFPRISAGIPTSFLSAFLPEFLITFQKCISEFRPGIPPGIIPRNLSRLLSRFSLITFYRYSSRVNFRNISSNFIKYYFIIFLRYENSSRIPPGIPPGIPPNVSLRIPLRILRSYVQEFL